MTYVLPSRHSAIQEAVPKVVNQLWLKDKYRSTNIFCDAEQEG